MTEHENQKPHYIFKICLLGAGGVGKTCIAKRLCFNTFDINTKLTIGIDFYTHDIPILVNGEEAFTRLSVWDFGGQEQFKKLFSYYIGGANGILMAFELINLQTLIALEWWYDQLKKYNKIEVPRVLVGTKEDMIEEVSKQEIVKDMIIHQYMKKYNETEFIKTSSKENVNIQKSFKILTRRTLEDHQLPFDKIL